MKSEYDLSVARFQLLAESLLEKEPQESQFHGAGDPGKGLPSTSEQV